MTKRTVKTAAAVLAGFTVAELEAELDRRRATPEGPRAPWDSKAQTVSVARGRQVAADCSDAYSVDAFFSWQDLGAALAKRGLTEREIEAVLRSKFTRWAADEACGSKGKKYGHLRATDLVEWLGTQGALRPRTVTQADLDRLVDETFETRPVAGR